MSMQGVPLLFDKKRMIINKKERCYWLSFGKGSKIDVNTYQRPLV